MNFGVVLQRMELALLPAKQIWFLLILHVKIVHNVVFGLYTFNKRKLYLKNLSGKNCLQKIRSKIQSSYYIANGEPKLF